MASDIPWSVLGVEPEAQEAAKMAARRQGVPLGQWLTHTILAAATQELKHEGRRNGAGDRRGAGNGHDTTGDPNAPDLVSRSQEMFGQKFTTSTEPIAGRSGPPALTPEAVLESIQKLAARVEEAETRTTEAIAPLADRISSLDTQIGEIRERTPVSTAPVERAMMRLTERLEKLESERKGTNRRGLAGRLFGRD